MSHSKKEYFIQLIAFKYLIYLGIISSSCSKVRNVFDETRLACGPEAVGEYDFVKVFDTEQQVVDLKSFTDSKAEIETEKGNEEVTITSRGCLAIPRTSGQVSISIPSQKVATSFAIHSGKKNPKAVLTAIPKISVSTTCPKDGLFAHEKIISPFQLRSEGDMNSVRIEVRAIQKSDGKNIILLQSEPGLNEIILPETIDVSQLPEGEYSVAIYMKDPLRGIGAAPIAVESDQSCELTIVHSSPLDDSNSSSVARLKLGEIYQLPTPSLVDENFLCFEKSSLTMESQSCTAYAECRELSNFKEGSFFKFPEPGIFNVLTFQKNRAGLKNKTSCRKVVVSDVSPTLNVLWRDDNFNAQNPVMKHPHFSLSVDINVSHPLIDSKTLESTLMCKVEVTSEDKSTLPGRDFSCLNGRCLGQSMEEYRPCGSRIEISLVEFWKKNWSTHTTINFWVKASDLSGNSRETVKSLLVDFSQWETDSGVFEKRLSEYEEKTAFRHPLGGFLLQFESGQSLLFRDGSVVDSDVGDRTLLKKFDSNIASFDMWPSFSPDGRRYLKPILSVLGPTNWEMWNQRSEIRWTFTQHMFDRNLFTFTDEIPHRLIEGKLEPYTDGLPVDYRECEGRNYSYRRFGHAELLALSCWSGSLLIWDGLKWHAFNLSFIGKERHVQSLEFISQNIIEVRTTAFVDQSEDVRYIEFKLGRKEIVELSNFSKPMETEPVVREMAHQKKKLLFLKNVKFPLQKDIYSDLSIAPIQSEKFSVENSEMNQIYEINYLTDREGAIFWKFDMGESWKVNSFHVNNYSFNGEMLARRLKTTRFESLKEGDLLKDKFDLVYVPNGEMRENKGGSNVIFKGSSIEIEMVEKGVRTEFPVHFNDEETVVVGFVNEEWIHAFLPTKKGYRSSFLWNWKTKKLIHLSRKAPGQIWISKSEKILSFTEKGELFIFDEGHWIPFWGASQALKYIPEKFTKFNDNRVSNAPLRIIHDAGEDRLHIWYEDLTSFTVQY